MKTSKKKKVHVKKGDIIQVISGNYKNQIGKIIRIIPKKSQVIVENLNLKTKHIKPKREEESGQITNFEAPIHSSNVMLYSIKHKIRSRYHTSIDAESIKYRKLNKTQEIIK